MAPNHFCLSYSEVGVALSIHHLGSDNRGCRESWGNMSFSRNHWKHGNAAHYLYGILSSFQGISVPKRAPFPRDEAQKDQGTWISPRFLISQKEGSKIILKEQCPSGRGLTHYDREPGLDPWCYKI